MVSKEKWIEVVKDFQGFELPRIVEREAKIPLEVPIQRAVVITGPRRAGKTYEMFLLISRILKTAEKGQVLYVNLERADLGAATQEDLVRMREAFFEVFPENRKRKVWLFLDEIQNVQNWEKFVRTALDENIHVFLSGSSSRLLSREIATSMRGRSLSYSIFPFSFREYLKAKGIVPGKFPSSAEKAKLVNALRDYMEFGGYPEAVLYREGREKILAEIMEAAIYRDVVERGKIRNVRAMRLLITALINSPEFSVNKFYNFLKSGGIKIGKNSLYKYLQFLEDAFFVFLLNKFSPSYKKAEQSIPKAYFVDNGLLHTSGISDRGRLMENLVFMELLRRGHGISYYKAATKEEVDFVIRGGKKAKHLIQVCYSIENFGTKERETRALIKAGKELKCGRLTVITWDYAGEEKIKSKRIKFIPLWKWLLEEAPK